jgi:hypothetical protein
MITPYKYFVALLKGRKTMNFSWIILVFFLTIASMNSYALEISTQVTEIEISEKGYEHSLVFLASGEVAKIKPGQNELLQQLLSAKDHQQSLKLTMNKGREITHVDLLSATLEQDTSVLSSSQKSLNVENPTVLNSLSIAQKYFSSARYKHKESQCFNRAHIWSYEWKTQNRINTSKMFIFFSIKYIREHDFQWWFHVAPYVHVVIGTDIKERIMDRKYLSAPGSVREWIDRLIIAGTQCRTIEKFSEYSNYPESGDCYLLRSSMYTYWPLDLEMEELNGTKKRAWVEDEIEQAYSEALDIKI